MVQVQLAKVRVRAVVKDAEGVEVQAVVVRVQVRAAIAFVPSAAQKSRTGQDFLVMLCRAPSAAHKWSENNPYGNLGCQW